MKLYLLILAVLFSTNSEAEILSPMLCGDQLKSSLPIFQTALDNLYSFSYIRSALQEESVRMPESEYCVSSIALGGNIYQYFNYLILVEVRSKNSTDINHFQFLFQDASVQAFHNIGGQPWAGLELTKLREVFRKLIEQAQFRPQPKSQNYQNLVEIAMNSRTFKNNSKDVNLDSFSAIPLGGNGSGGFFYLVTWLTNPNSNPFLYPILSRGVLISIDAFGGIEIAENIAPFADIWLPLEENVLEINSELSSDVLIWKNKLLQISN